MTDHKISWRIRVDYAATSNSASIMESGKAKKQLTKEAPLPRGQTGTEEKPRERENENRTRKGCLFSELFFSLPTLHNRGGIGGRRIIDSDSP